MNDTDVAGPDRGAFVWYELMTSDPLAAKTFYDSVVGWDIDAENSVPDGHMDYRMIKRPDGSFAGGVLALSPDMAASGARPGWLGYVHVPDVDAAAQRFVDSGGVVQMPPTDMEGVGRMALVSDPQGAPIYVMTPTPPPGNPGTQSDVFDFAKPQHFRWNELQTSDPHAATQFYTDLFGWEQKNSMPMPVLSDATGGVEGGEMGDYLFIERADGPIGAIMSKLPDAPQSAWSYYIGVDDIDRAATAVIAGGGKHLGPINEIPGGEFSVHCLDPQGAKFGLVGPRKGN